MVDGNWDVDKYKTEHESDEHWELRRKFLMTHKDTLPEDELVCMAQCFTNIEFLGCRYPQETMIRVAELAKGVVEDFREKKKNNLKRTFVAASDAAQSKVKGLVGENLTNLQETPAKRLRELPGPLGKFILVVHPGVKPVGLLAQAVQSNGIQHTQAKYIFTDKNNGIVECKYELCNEEFGIGSAADKKSAKEMAATAALEKLKKTCYTIVVKKKIFGQSVDTTDLGVSSSSLNSQQLHLGDDNVGCKLMKLMGWAGGGLGSAAQGRVEPVEATMTVHRAGLGVSPQDDIKQFRRAVNNYFRDWLRRGGKPDLVFSTDFDKEHRKVAHQVAACLGLKSQSYGSDGNRKLVISKKIRLWDLAVELAQTGGCSDKYDLLEPGVP